MTGVYKFVFVSIVSSALVGASAKGSKDVAVETFVSAGDLAAKAAPGTVVNEIPNTIGYQVLMVRRDQTGDAEVHMKMNDTIIIERGTGKFRVGGTITGNHEIQPTEWRGGVMTGSREYTVSVGDLLVIPAGVPHQAIVTSGTLMYLAIKTPNQQQ
jgi:mannose-6-phosphate isomerase-like protein (cupin superfamily)